MTTNKTIVAWQQASQDLEIMIHAPFVLKAESKGETIHCIALVEDFGSPNGTVVLGRHTPSKSAQLIAHIQGRFFSLVDEESYSVYSRSLFVATLNDWGWFGARRQPPEWYTGQPWMDPETQV
ncbi:MAG: hypothetical protein HKL80_11355 [Acidimicrobiales bacterium]|nr:hypothetical protein [Acidimicrobiales bacterium]